MQFSNEKEVLALVETLSGQLTKPLIFEDLNLDLDMRIGYSYSQTTTDNPMQALDEHIRKAKIAAAHAYEKKIFYYAYNESEDSFNKQQLSLAADLRTALELDQLHIVYQPQILLSTGECYGIEALLRWIHPQQGFISPEVFVSIAEKNGLIKLLTLWVIKKALVEFKDICEMKNSLQLSVNISVLNLHETKFI